jgi:hypothetical protein
MQALKLRRRTFLRGAGVALALPMLDAMLDRHGTAYADGTPLPTRYVLVYGSHSLGMGYNDPNLPEFSRDEPRDMFVPDALGADYDLKLALSPLGDYGVKDLVSVVSGLRVPYASSSDEPIPAGGMPNVFHGPQLKPLATGVNSYGPAAPSSDQIVADVIAGDTVFPFVFYRAMPVTYWIDNFDNGSSISADKDGNYLAPIASPNIAYKAMMDKIALTDPTEAAARELLKKQRKSVLDLVLGTSSKLIPRLGEADRQRLERHFDEIRDLEIRMDKAEVLCESLPIPEDPPIGGTVVTASEDGTENIYTSEWDTKGWSDEPTRARLLADLIAMAFRCDLTRVVPFELGGGTLSVYHMVGARVDVHGCSHFSGTSTTDTGTTLLMSQVMQSYFISSYAYLVDKLRDMIDSCAIVYFSEGGVGRSMENPEPEAQPNAHSTENMACLIAGRAGGLKGGVHVRAPDDRNHPANVLISAMKAVGVPDEKLGEVSGAIPELFV